MSYNYNIVVADTNINNLYPVSHQFFFDVGKSNNISILVEVHNLDTQITAQACSMYQYFKPIHC